MSEASTQNNAETAKSFREYIEQHRAEITALQLLYSRPYKQRLTEKMLKELEKKLREHHAAWTEDHLWAACAAANPGKVKGRSQAGRFADLVALVRFALEQQPVPEPFAESVITRFNEWLNLIRDHIATSLSIDRFGTTYMPSRRFSQPALLAPPQVPFHHSIPSLHCIGLSFSGPVSGQNLPPHMVTLPADITPDITSSAPQKRPELN